MRQCFYCTKYLWPWQKRYLGYLAVAHAACDMIAFKESLKVIRHANPALPPQYENDQIAHRTSAYS